MRLCATRGTAWAALDSRTRWFTTSVATQEQKVIDEQQGSSAPLRRDLFCKKRVLADRDSGFVFIQPGSSPDSGYSVAESSRLCQVSLRMRC
jgi:hypothetical protein